MSKCPYCNNELHLDDFFHTTTKETKKGIKKETVEFTGEEIGNRSKKFYGARAVTRMWVCPSCDKILSITEFSYHL
jgi:hypothetical protein